MGDTMKCQHLVTSTILKCKFLLETGQFGPQHFSSWCGGSELSGHFGTGTEVSNRLFRSKCQPNCLAPMRSACGLSVHAGALWSRCMPGRGEGHITLCQALLFYRCYYALCCFPGDNDSATPILSQTVHSRQNSVQPPVIFDLTQAKRYDIDLLQLQCLSVLTLVRLLRRHLQPLYIYSLSFRGQSRLARHYVNPIPNSNPRLTLTLQPFTPTNPNPTDSNPKPSQIIGAYCSRFLRPFLHGVAF